MINKSSSYAVLIYGCILIFLGCFAYYTAASKISFYMGLGTGALLVISSFLMFAGNVYGGYIAVFVTLALTAVFGIRYSITHKSLPAILSVLSGGMLLFLLAKTANWRK